VARWLRFKPMFSANYCCANSSSGVNLSRAGLGRAWVLALPTKGAGGARSSRVRGRTVLIARPFVMAVLATLLGPAIGVGLFVLLHNF
jgi:hypothetical protein